MSIFESPKFLRNVLFADAASCLATGALQVALTRPLAELFGLPGLLLQGTGLFLLAYAGVLMVAATREPISRALVWVFVAGNFAWAAVCIALLVEKLVTPTALGAAWMIVQAAVVVVLAQLQWTALRRNRTIGWA